MNDIINRPPTNREVYERIQERIKECEEREKITARKTSNWVTETHEHPDMHFWRLLEMIFRPIEEGADITLSEFFQMVAKWKTK